MDIEPLPLQKTLEEGADGGPIGPVGPSQDSENKLLWIVPPDASFSTNGSSSNASTTNSKPLPTDELLKEMALSAVQTVNKSPYNSIGSDLFSSNPTRRERVTPRTLSSMDSPAALSSAGATGELAVAAEEAAERFQDGAASYARRSVSGNAFDTLMRSSVYEGMTISIPSFQTADRGGNKHTLYTIVVKLATGHTWNVHRRYKQMSSLHHAIKSKVSAEDLPSFPAKRYLVSSLSSSFVEDRRNKLEKYLKVLVRINQVWEIDQMANFLDDDSKSMSLRLQYMHLLQDNDNFDKLCVSSGEVLRNCAQAVRNQDQLIDKLKTRCADQEDTIKLLQGQLKKLRLQAQLNQNLNGLPLDGSSSDGIPVPPSSSISSRKLIVGSFVGKSPLSAGSGIFMNTPVMESLVNRIVASPRNSLVGGGRGGSAYDRASETVDAIMENPRVSSFAKNSVGQLPHTVREERRVEFNDPTEGLAHDGRPMTGATAITNDAWTSSNSQNGALFSPVRQYTNSPGVVDSPLPMHRIPVHIDQHSSDEYVGDVLQLLHPNSNGRSKRLQVREFFCGLFLKNAAVGHICTSGNSALGTALPGEPLLLTVFTLSREDERKFLEVHGFLCERMLDGKTSKSSEVVDCVATDRAPDRSLVLKCTVNGIKVVVTSNSLRGLYLTAMVEEADQIIGKNHLVTRGLLLVRAWCSYEGEAQWGDIAKAATLSDDTLFVIVMYIFNMYHERLHFPLQVLVTFLSVMSSFSWETLALTVHGPMELRGPNAGKLVIAPGQGATRVLSENFIMRYMDKYAESNGEGHSTKSGSAKGRTKSSHRHRRAASSSSSSDEDDGEVALSSLNILCPLCPSHNLSFTLGEQNAAKLRSSFVQGARTFEPIVKRINDDCEDVSSLHKTWPAARNPTGPGNGKFGRSMVDRLNNCFPNLLKVINACHVENNGLRGGSPWSSGGLATTLNQEATKGFLGSAAGPAMQISKADLSMKHHIETTYLLFTNGFSGERLMKLTKSILQQRGPMPVGEIGKVLKEKIANDRLSSILKDKFGGLKNFLEQFYGDEFVLGTNHKFNPKVYLRKKLTSDEIDSIKNGKDLPNKKKSGRKNKAKRSQSGNTKR
jgi:hypothetical protein